MPFSACCESKCFRPAKKARADANQTVGIVALLNRRGQQTVPLEPHSSSNEVNTSLPKRRFRSFTYGVGSSSSSIFQQQKGDGCDAISVLLLFPSLFAFSHHSPRLTLRFCADDPGTSKRISRANSSPLGGDRGGQRHAGGPGRQVESLTIK